MYHPFMFAVLEFLRCFWYVVDMLCMMPYSMVAKYVHATSKVGVKFYTIYIAHFSILFCHL